MIEFDRHPSKPELDDNDEVIAAHDWLGNRFAVGDTVIYCVGAGRGQLMALGKVLKIKSVLKFRHEYREPRDGETPNFTGLDGTAWVRENVPWDDVTVQVLTAKTSGSWDNKARTKPAWVNPKNITSITGLQTVEIS